MLFGNIVGMLLFVWVVLYLLIFNEVVDVVFFEIGCEVMYNDLV